jgi:hypothetical protein
VRKSFACSQEERDRTSYHAAVGLYDDPNAATFAESLLRWHQPSRPQDRKC